MKNKGLSSLAYNQGVRRLFQFGAVLMLIGALYPLLELFDRWDPPGISNDTEFAVYVFLFAICLLVSRLISSEALNFGLFSLRIFSQDEKVKPVEADHLLIFAVLPLFKVPLRI